MRTFFMSSTSNPEAVAKKVTARVVEIVPEKLAAE